MVEKNDEADVEGHHARLTSAPDDDVEGHGARHQPRVVEDDDTDGHMSRI